jgi:acyl carrier protein
VSDAAGRTTLLADELAKIKSMVTVNTPPLSQAVIAGMLLACQGRISELNTETAAYYANAMRSTLRQLDRCFPAERREALRVRWNRPDGGFFLTMRVPFRADNAALARSAEDFGVIWTPMSYFYPEGGGNDSIRLSISYLTDEDITEGISRLARFIEAEASARPTAPWPRLDAASRLWITTGNTGKGAVAMTEQEIFAGFAETIEEFTGVPADEVGIDASLADDLDIDSLSMIELVVATQDRFGIEIPDEDLRPLKTVRDVVGYVRRAQRVSA